MKHVKKLRKKLYTLKETEGIEFVHGSGKHKSLLQKGRAENMEYDAVKDSYRCRDGRELIVIKTTKSTTKSGYERETTVYGCQDCGGCRM